VRVLLVTDSYPPVVDGIATSVSALAVGLLELGHEVLVVAPDPRGAPSGGVEVRGFPHFALPGAGYPVVIASARQYDRVVDRFSPDVVHVHTLAVLGMTATNRSCSDGPPSVLTWHTDVLAYRQAYPLLRLVIPAVHLRWALPGRRGDAVRDVLGMVLDGVLGRDVTPRQSEMLAVAVDRHHYVVAPSHKAAQRVPSLRGVPVDVVPSAVVERAVSSCRNASTSRRAGKVIAFVGRPEPEKNFTALLEAMRRCVLPEHPDAVLAVVGRVRDHRRMRRALTMAEVGHAVRFLGVLPNSGIVPFLTRCRMLALPSVTETQGLVLSEAALAGCPAVVMDAELDGLVQHERTGLVAETPAALGAALVRLLDDPALCEKLGSAARRAVVRYTHLDMARGLVDIYTAVVAPSGHTATDSTDR